jgi:hypothetical protein
MIFMTNSSKASLPKVPWWFARSSLAKYYGESYSGPDADASAGKEKKADFDPCAGLPERAKAQARWLNSTQLPSACHEPEMAVCSTPGRLNGGPLLQVSPLSSKLLERHRNPSKR